MTTLDHYQARRDLCVQQGHIQDRVLSPEKVRKDTSPSRREGHAFCNTTASMSWSFREHASLLVAGNRNQVVEAERTERCTSSTDSWQRPSQRTRPEMTRSIANLFRGSQRDNRVVTLTFLVLTFSVHGCELWICKRVRQLALAQICHYINTF